MIFHMELITIKTGSKAPTSGCEEIHSQTLAYYELVGYVEPWISYYLQDDNCIVGCCSFKGKPDSNNKVEIAYYTFEQFEGKGYGSRMCAMLTAIAQEQKSVTISARTLPLASASTAILEKNGFQCIGTVIDPEDGEVWEWILRHPNHARA